MKSWRLSSSEPREQMGPFQSEAKGLRIGKLMVYVPVLVQVQRQEVSVPAQRQAERKNSPFFLSC